VFLWSVFCLFFGLFCSLVNSELKKSAPAINKETATLRAIEVIRQLQSNYAAKHGGRYAPTFED
jgi:hypothetical protein